MAGLNLLLRRARDVVATPRRRALAFAIVATAWTCIGACAFHRQARAQTPKVFSDTFVYFDIAAQPPRVEQLFYPKPFVTPLLFRALDRDPARIERFQQPLAVIAWTVLGLALALALRRARARLAAGAIALAFLLAPFRVGWSSTILTESLNDSLLALVIGAAVALAAVSVRLARGRRRTLACWSLGGLVAVLAIVWLLTRDTNAITALVAAVVASVLWGVHRGFATDDRWAPALVTLIVAASCFALWSASVIPDVPLARFASWPHEILARRTPSIINDIARRVASDPDARSYFVEQGLPQADELASASALGAGNPTEMVDAALAPAREWIASRGASVYSHWLLRHVFARTGELVAHASDVLTPEIRFYMPDGWQPRASHGARRLVQLTTTERLLIVLLLATPVLWVLARRHMFARISAVLIVSGAISAAAAYYGDSIEIARHCYGSGQQIVIGLYVALLAWLDGPITASRDTRRDRSADRP